MLRDFIVIYDDTNYRVQRALDAQDAATMACDRIWNDTAGEAFDLRHGTPTPLTVREVATGEVTSWNIAVEMVPAYCPSRALAPTPGEPNERG